VHGTQGLDTEAVLRHHRQRSGRSMVLAGDRFDPHLRRVQTCQEGSRGAVRRPVAADIHRVRPLPPASSPQQQV
ncbi:MAG: hypothetical protein AVDCRST_MAG43-910, partial [uncultured Thermomicrobiales bacterium]